MQSNPNFRLFIGLLLLTLVGLSATFTAVAATRWPGGPGITPGGSPTTCRATPQPVLLPLAPSSQGMGMGMASFFLMPDEPVAAPTPACNQPAAPQTQTKAAADSQAVGAKTAPKNLSASPKANIATKAQAPTLHLPVAQLPEAVPQLQSAEVEKIAQTQKANKGKGFFSKLWTGIKNIMMDTTTQVIAIVICLLFGGLGIHRVILGGKWWLILLYIITFGGIFGILPLIDLIFLIIEPDRYQGNSKFFGFL